MKTLLLDRSAWDLVLNSDGNIALASEPYAIAQDVASAVRLFLGELWYDTTKGVPYFNQILGRPLQAAFVKAQVVKAARSVPGVTSAVCTLNALQGRALSGQVVVTYELPAPTSAALAQANTPTTGRALISFVGDNGGLVVFVGDDGGSVEFYGTL